VVTGEFLVSRAWNETNFAVKHWEYRCCHGTLGVHFALIAGVPVLAYIRRLAHSITKAVVVASVLVSSCAAQRIRADLVGENVVRDRLLGGMVANKQRQSTIRSLFHDAGCEADDQPIDNSHGNVVCTLPGQTDSSVIVGGHLDFVDRGDGIVDDWSGTAFLPSLYQALKNQPRRNTYVFVAFAEEERGLIGSSFYVKSLTADQRAPVRAYVNLECLGLTSAKVWVHRSTPGLVKELLTMANALAMPLQEVDVERIGDDDTHPFLSAKIPVISIHSLTPENFRILHSVNDTPKAIHFDDYYNAYKLVAMYLAYLDVKQE
jgi:putative aminopeptidase FrvX